MVQIPLGDVSGVLLNSAVAWQVIVVVDPAHPPVLPARREERVDGAVGDAEDCTDEVADDYRTWISGRGAFRPFPHS